MRRQIVIYKAKPEHSAENQRLLTAVFDELRAKQPTDLRYLALRLSDDSYVHVVFSDTAENEPSPFSRLEAFRAYQAEVRSRIAAPPLQSEATIVGDYRMLTE